MVASLLRLAGLDWPVPDHSTPCRGQKTLEVQIPSGRADGPLNLLVDSTGIKFPGDGEWPARKHGGQGRRQWRRVHLAMDTATSGIRAVEFTPVGKAIAPSCRTCRAGSLKTKTSAPLPQTGPATRAAATAPSPHTVALRSSRSARTVGHGRKTARPPGRALKPCAPHVTMAVRSGTDGPDTTPATAPKPGYAASSPSANASLQGTQTAGPANSTSASPS